jgi:hypothetical protein
VPSATPSSAAFIRSCQRISAIFCCLGGISSMISRARCVMSLEEAAQLGDVVLRDPGLAAITHAAPPRAARASRLCRRDYVVARRPQSL